MRIAVQEAPFELGAESDAFAAGVAGAGAVVTKDIPAMAIAALHVAALGPALRSAVPGGELLIAACLAPIALTLIGIDIPRWHAIAGFNLFAVALLLAPERADRAGRWLCLLAPLGPLGIGWALPLWLSPG